MSTPFAASAAPGSVNPADGSPLEPIAWATPDDVAAAIAAAREAQAAWGATLQHVRNDALRTLARTVLERRDEIAAIMAAETGRHPTDCIMSEIVFLVDNVEAAIRVAAKALAPERVKLSMLDYPGKKITVEAVPRGVIGIIAPWNYPLANFWKSLFPALLSGNGVVMKPSEYTPRTGQWLAERCAEILPAGVVQCVQGRGDVGQALIDHGVDGLVFTGSLATGRKVAARAGEALIPCSVELGGKDAAIVLADCDLERTAIGVAHWALHNAGQDCSAVERVYVEAAIADAFVDRVAKIAARVRVMPQAGGAEIGPLQNEPQLRIVESHVADAVEKGARLLAGGAPTGSGYGFQPTVLDGCTPEMRIMREETFGPVIAVQRVADAEEAVRLANDADYGLCGSVWTRDVRKGEALARRLNVGVAMVNNHAFTGTMPETPWSGVKGTGSGVAMSKHAYNTFVRRRTLLIDSNKGPDPWWFPANADLDAFADAVSRKALGSFGSLFTIVGLLGKRVKAIRELARG